MPVKVSQIDERTWEFDEEGVRFFLLAGEEKALLIDSGMKTQNAKELAGEKTSLPLFLLNTHADMDHIGSNGEFDAIYPSHGTCPVKPELIMKLYEGAGKILAGEIPGRTTRLFGNPVMAYDTGAATFLCDAADR